MRLFWGYERTETFLWETAQQERDICYQGVYLIPAQAEMRDLDQEN